MEESLASPVSDDEALHRLVVSHARTIVGARAAAIGIAEQPDDLFARWVTAGEEASSEGPCARAARGVLGQVLRAPRAIRVADCSALPELDAFSSAACFMGAPLRHVERTFGAVYVTRAAGEPPFNEDDAFALHRFTSRAALVLELAVQRRRAQHAVSSRDIVLATVSHDLGNPLGSIWMSCASLLRDTPKVDRRRTRPLLDIIKRSAERMQRLIDDLMAAATLESGNLSVDRKRTASCDLLREAARLFRPLTDARGQMLDLQLPDPLPDVMCDRERILQVLANLVGNAIKFSPSASRIAIVAEVRGGEVVISVSDSGPGIAPEAVPHIFDRYWKASPRARGAGLGLYVAREIVSAHDGRIWVESEPGAGATFSFALAIAEREGPGLAVIREAQPDLARASSG